MSIETIPLGSIEYIRVPTSITDGVTTIIIPTKVEAGLSADPQTPPASWLTATYTATAVQFLLNTSSVGAGTWWVWVRITDNPQTVIRHAPSPIVIG